MVTCFSWCFGHNELSSNISTSVASFGRIGDEDSLSACVNILSFLKMLNNETRSGKHTLAIVSGMAIAKRRFGPGNFSLLLLQLKVSQYPRRRMHRFH
jgi:hypothetical protein